MSSLLNTLNFGYRSKLTAGVFEASGKYIMERPLHMKEARTEEEWMANHKKAVEDIHSQYEEPVKLSFGEYANGPVEVILGQDMLIGDRVRKDRYLSLQKYLDFYVGRKLKIWDKTLYRFQLYLNNPDAIEMTSSGFIWKLPSAKWADTSKTDLAIRYMFRWTKLAVEQYFLGIIIPEDKLMDSLQEMKGWKQANA